MKIDYKRLFPEPPDKNFNFKIDNDSVSYITTPTYSEIITRIIIRECEKIFDNPNDLTILDGTAGVGGDTISFCNHFKNVYAIEKDKKRYEMLKHNLNKFNFENVITENDDSLEYINKLNNIDIVYFDPPWGGSDYKKYDKINLTISDINLHDIINKIFINENVKLIVLKLPKNYDLENIYDKLKNNFTLSICKLQKMIILMINLK
jgi:16S rRNA G966 N2-methylase RsmD